MKFYCFLFPTQLVTKGVELCRAVVPKMSGIALLGAVERSGEAVRQKGAAGWH